MLIALARPHGEVTAQAHTCPSVLEPAQLLTEHAAFVDTLACGMQAKAVRRRGGRVLLGLHPDLAAWMSRPAPDRLAEVRRLDAWPFLSWCFATGRLVPDLDLLAGKGRAPTSPRGCRCTLRTSSAPVELPSRSSGARPG